MRSWSAKKLFYGLLAFGGAYLLGGEILNAVSNAMAHINWYFTILGTVACLCLWFTLQAVLRRHPADFRTYSIKRLTYLPACGLVGIFLLLWTPPIVNFIHLLRRPNPTAVTSNTKTKEASVVVLVSEFAGMNPQSYGVTDIIFDQLTDAVKDYGDVKVKRIRESIDSSETAQVKGKQDLADIVLWGSYLTNQAQTRVTIHFEVMDKPFDIPLRQDKETVSVRTAKLESFTIQEELSKQMSYLVLLTLGITRLEAADLEGAIGSFTRAILLSPAPDQIIEPYHIYDYRGICYLLKGQLDEAISDYSQAIIYVRKPDLLQMRAMAYLLKKQYDKSFDDVNDAIRIQGDDQFYAFRGFIYLYIRDDERRAFADFQKAIELNPENSSALSNRASIYIGQKNWDSAIVDLETILALDVDRKKQSHAYNGLALAYEGKGDTEKALLNYALAIQAEPQNNVPYLNRATLYSKQRRPDDAIIDANAAIVIDPEESRNYSVRGTALRAKGQFDEAIADYTKAITLEPDDSEIYGQYYNRGATSFEKGDLDSAIRDYDYSIKLNPKFSDAYGNRCNAFLSKQQFDRAISDCDKSISLNPANSMAYSNRGAASASKGKFIQAMTDFNRAIELDPSNIRAHLNLGLAYKDQGQRDNAIAKFRTVIQMGGDNVPIMAARRELCALAPDTC